MRSFLLSTMPAGLWIMTALNLLFLCLLLLLYRKTRDSLPLWVALVAFGLFYDALMLALGTVLAPSEPFRILSLFRFVLHCGLIPLLFPICSRMLGFSKKAHKIIWIATLVIMAVGITAGFSTVLEVKTVGGVVRFASADGLTPGWSTGIQNALSYGPVLILIAAGIAVWIRKKNPYLFLSGLFMFAFAALGPATGNFDLIFDISMFGEVFMALFLWIAAKKDSSISG